MPATHPLHPFHPLHPVHKEILAQRRVIKLRRVEPFDPRIPLPLPIRAIGVIGVVPIGITVATILVICVTVVVVIIEVVAPVHREQVRVLAEQIEFCQSRAGLQG